MLNSVPGLIDSKLEASQATTDFQLSELAAALKGSLVDITEQLGQTVVSTAAPATNISSAGPSQLPASFAAAAASPKPVTHRPVSFLHASASPALDAAILNASFALRTNTQTARQVLEQYGVQALLANIEYLTEADRTDDVLIEAIASASGPPLDGVSPSPSPASGSRPPFLAASESLADAVLPPSGPRLSLGSANPITLSAPCKGQTDATNVTSRQPLQASPCFISCFVSILLHSPCVSCILSFVYFMPAATAASAGWGHPPFKLLDLY